MLQSCGYHFDPHSADSLQNYIVDRRNTLRNQQQASISEAGLLEPDQASGSGEQPPPEPSGEVPGLSAGMEHLDLSSDDRQALNDAIREYEAIRANHNDVATYEHLVAPLQNLCMKTEGSDKVFNAFLSKTGINGGKRKEAFLKAWQILQKAYSESGQSQEPVSRERASCEERRLAAATNAPSASGAEFAEQLFAQYSHQGWSEQDITQLLEQLLSADSSDEAFERFIVLVSTNSKYKKHTEDIQNLWTVLRISASEASSSEYPLNPEDLSDGLEDEESDQ